MTLARMANFGFAFARAAVTRAMKFAALFAAREVSTRPDPASRRGNLLKRAAACLAALLVPAISQAVPYLSFQGVVLTLNTGSVTLGYPDALAVDSVGNLYIADSTNNRIVIVNPQGVASVLAITGLSTPLNLPRGVAVDASGNLYIGDQVNQRVVKVSSAGVGTVVNMGSVTLNHPQGVAVDASGNLFVADPGSNQIVKVPSGGTAAVLHITGLSAPLSSPPSLAVDRNGTLYIADPQNSRIVTVAAGGAAGSDLAISNVTLNSPLGVSIDGIGNVFIADSGNGRVVTVDPQGNGNVLFIGSAGIGNPVAIAVDVFGTVHAADPTASAVYTVYPGFNPSLTYGTNRSAVGFGHLPLGSTTGVTRTLPFTIANTAITSLSTFTVGTNNLDFTIASGTTCAAGTMSASCSVNVKFLPTAPGLRRGAIVLYGSGTPAAPMLTIPLFGFADAPLAALSPNAASVVNIGTGNLALPFQIALDGSGNLFVGNYSWHNVLKVPAAGGSSSIVSTGSVATQNVTGVALDGAGNLFLSDHLDDRIVVVTPGGVSSVLSISNLSLGLDEPTGLFFDAAGTLYISDWQNGRVVEVSGIAVAGTTSTGTGTVLPTGAFTISTGTDTGVAVDGNGLVYIADRSNNRVIAVPPIGPSSVVTATGVSALNNTQGMGVDPMNNLYIADSGNNRIVQITTAGNASVVQVPGLTAPTTLAAPFGVTVDANGNIFIPDWTNNRIVYVNVSGASLAFPNTNVSASSTAKTATVTNLGNQALALSGGPTFTSNSFSANSSDTNLCASPSLLQAGAFCDVSVVFSPQTAGSLTGGIFVTDNTNNISGASQNVAVRGFGVYLGDSTSLAVTTTPATTASLNQGVTIAVTLSDTQSGFTATIPTGTVTLTDTVGTTTTMLNGGAPITLTAGVATLTNVLFTAAGNHVITALYGGVTGSFLGATNTAALTIIKDAFTIAGPAAQALQFLPGTGGSVAITLTGSITGAAAPTGSLAWTILNSANTSVGTGNATLTAGSTSSTASIPISGSLTPGTYTLRITYAGDLNYLASSAATIINFTIAKATPTVTLTSTAAAIFTGGSVTFTATLASTSGTPTGTVNFYDGSTLLGSGTLASNSASFTTTSLATGSHTITAAYLGDSIFLAVTSSALSESVSKATPTVALTSSAAAIFTDASVTFTATVSSTSGTPTGTVKFYDGSTVLGSGTLASGSASFTTTSLASGSHSITAAYQGDTDFAAVTSSAFTESVSDFDLNIASSSSSSSTVMPGGIDSYSLLLSPSNGTTFPAAVTLSISGLPPGASATLTPNSLPAGSSATPIAIAVQIPTNTSASAQKINGRFALAFGLTPMLGIVLLPFSAFRKRAARFGRASLLLLCTLAATSLLCLAGCGSANTGFLGNQSHSYVLTVTATSGGLSHSTTLNLKVQ